jgi:O-antigen ligase
VTELVLLWAFAALAACALLAWMANPWRSLVAWVCLLSVQLPFELFFPDFRPALSDVFVPSMVLGIVLFRSRTGSAAGGNSSPLSNLVLLFTALFFTLGNALTYFELRTLPQWTWLNKDIGLLDLVLCYFVFLYLVDSREKLHAIVKIFVLSGSALNVLALLGGVARYVFGIPNLMMRELGTLRLCGLMVNPNSYGGFILCVFLLQFALLLGGSALLGLSRQAQYVNLAFLGMACLMTQSRSALLGMIAGIAALLLFFRVRAGLRLAGVTLLMVLGMASVVRWYNASAKTSADFWEAELSSNTISQRLDTNRAAWQMYLDSPRNALLGIGVGAFLVRGQNVLGLPMIIHNDILWLLVELGPLGLFLFGAIFAVCFRNCIVAARAQVSESPIAIGVACSLFATLAWTAGTEGFWHRHVWFLLALSESCYRACVPDRLPLAAKKPRQFSESGTRLIFAPARFQGRGQEFPSTN